MKAKALITATLLAFTNFAWAQGGLGIDNAEQHMGANENLSANNSRPEIIVQGPTDKFDVVVPARNRALVDTNTLKQSYNGQG